MSNLPVETIVFDLGGVLIDWNPRYLYNKIFTTQEDVDHFLEHVCTSEWNIMQDAGRPLFDATEWLVSQHPEWEKHIRLYYDRWEEMLGGTIDETVEILEALKNLGKHRLLALTNWSGETFPIALERYDFFRHFEGIVVSGDEKVIKPDPAIYQILLDRYSVNPSTAIFIDDSLKNVKGAAQVGIRGIHFRSPMQLREELADLL